MEAPPKRARATPERRVTFIGAPFAEGQDLDGCDLAPTAIRDAGLQPALEKLGWDVHDAGDLDLSSTTRAPPPSPPSPPSKDIPNCDSHIGEQLKLVHDAVAAAAAAGRVALTVGGDHSIAAASIAALQRAHPTLAVIWVDAHADANTPATSPSMHYHGMPAAHVMGRRPPVTRWLTAQARGAERDGRPRLPGGAGGGRRGGRGRGGGNGAAEGCLLYTSPSPRDS